MGEIVVVEVGTVTGATDGEVVVVPTGSVVVVEDTGASVLVVVVEAGRVVGVLVEVGTVEVVSGGVVVVDDGSCSQSRGTSAPADDTPSSPRCHVKVASAPTVPMMDVELDPLRTVSMSSTRYTSPVVSVR